MPPPPASRMGDGASLSYLLTGPWARAFAGACAADAELQSIAARSRFSFGWSVAGRQCVVCCANGAVQVSGTGGEQPDFTVAGPADVWLDWLAPVPPPGRHDLMAMIVTGGVRLDGDPTRFAQHLRVTRRLLELARASCRPAGGAPAEGGNTGDPVPGAENVAGAEDVTGGYITVEAGGERLRLFYEEAGAGVPVLLLHTAGADARQYRYMLADPAYRPFRLVAFDLPYHGRSLPPDGWWTRPYRLSTAFYADVVEAFVGARQLHRPVLVGASMAAQIMLELVLRRPAGYRGIAAFGAVDAVGGSPAAGLHQPEVNEAEVVPSWVAGLASPATSEARRRELWWCYSQAAAGVFAGDAAFFMEEWDATARLPSLDTSRCPVHLFAGEYDYSRPPARVRATAALIPGATFTELPGCGHFPMVEDPEQVKAHLMPMLTALHD